MGELTTKMPLFPGKATDCRRANSLIANSLFE
jgi:hypothetical protein